MRPKKPQAEIAVEVIYNNIHNLPHPDHGSLRLVYFGHQSEGQKTITRNVAEAIVMLLEDNGHYICNGLSEAADILRGNGYIVAAPDELEPPDPLPPVPSPVPSGVPFGGSFSENADGPDSGHDPNQLALGDTSE